MTRPQKDISLELALALRADVALSADSEADFIAELHEVNFLTLNHFSRC